MRPLVSRALLLAVAAPLGACLDLTITVLPDAGPSPVDAGEDGFALPVCVACMSAADMPGPGCGSEYTACRDDAQCSATVDCAIASGCFGTARKSFLGCGIPCASANGITTGNDPVLVVASSLFQCLANGPCAPACFSPE